MLHHLGETVGWMQSFGRNSRVDGSMDREIIGCYVYRFIKVTVSIFTIFTPTSYSGGPGFDSWLQRPTILIEVFRSFPQFLQANAGIAP
jgi:hypothetical protein